MVTVVDATDNVTDVVEPTTDAVTDFSVPTPKSFDLDKGYLADYRAKLKKYHKMPGMELSDEGPIDDSRQARRVFESLIMNPDMEEAKRMSVEQQKRYRWLFNPMHFSGAKRLDFQHDYLEFETKKGVYRDYGKSVEIIKPEDGDFTEDMIKEALLFSYGRGINDIKLYGDGLDAEDVERVATALKEQDLLPQEADIETTAQTKKAAMADEVAALQKKKAEAEQAAQEQQSKADASVTDISAWELS